MKADKNVFPYTLRDSNGKGTVYTGLQVRDYIAIQAMTGLLAGNWATSKEIAIIAYEMADAMIQQSEASSDKKCTPQMIAERDCEGDIMKCQGACYK